MKNKIHIIIMLISSVIACKEDDHRVNTNSYKPVRKPLYSWSIIGRKDSVIKVSFRAIDTGSRKINSIVFEYYEDSLYSLNSKTIDIENFYNNKVDIDLVGLLKNKNYWCRLVVSTDIDTFHFDARKININNLLFQNIFGSNLILYLPFDGNVMDKSGNNNNGDGFNLTAINDRFNFPNSAFYFNGANSYINIPKFNNLPYYPITISFWANFYVLASPGTENFQVIIGRDAFGNTSQGNLVLYSSADKSIQNKLMYWTGGSSVVSNITPILTDWQNFVFTFDNNQTKWYVNGVLNFTNNYTYNSSANIPFNIGCGGQRLYYKGLLDDIAIWNRVLSESEIKDVFYYK